MSNPTFVGRRDMERTISEDEAIDVMRDAFVAETRGLWHTPARIAAHVEEGSLLAMPCARRGENPALGAKLVTTFPGNAASGRPGVAGVYVLFDPHDGRPLLVLDGGYLTLLRTAAVTALAARVLSPAGASTLGVLGTGGQAEFHVRLVSRVRKIDRVVLWGRSEARANDLASRLVKEGFPVEVAPQSADAAKQDIVVTATGSHEPIVDATAITQNALVCAIGAHTPATRELSSDLVAAAVTRVVESKGTLAEAGDFQVPATEGLVDLSTIRTLGELVTAAEDSRTAGPTGIRVFKSCGIAFEDLALATQIARRLGVLSTAESVH